MCWTANIFFSLKPPPHTRGSRELIYRTKRGNGDKYGGECVLSHALLYRPPLYNTCKYPFFLTRPDHLILHAPEPARLLSGPEYANLTKPCCGKEVRYIMLIVG